MDDNILFKGFNLSFELMNSIPFLEGKDFLQILILTAIGVLIVVILAYVLVYITDWYDEHQIKRELKEANEQYQVIKEDVLKEYSNKDIILSIPEDMRNNTLRWQANIFKVSHEDLEKHIDKYIDQKLNEYDDEDK